MVMTEQTNGPAVTVAGILAEFTAGTADWPTTRDALIGFDYVKPELQPGLSDVGEDLAKMAEVYARIETEWNAPDDPNTIDALAVAELSGVLTAEQYEEVVDAIEAAAAAK